MHSHTHAELKGKRVAHYESPRTERNHLEKRYLLGEPIVDFSLLQEN